MTTNRMKKVAEQEIYKVAREYYAMARNKPLADTSAVMSMHGKMMGMRKLAWLLNLIDTAKAVEIDNKAKEDAANGEV